MSVGFFIVGGIIFALYMYFTIWNIVYSNRKQREENYPTSSVRTADVMDMDGMGNFSRFPTEVRKPTKKRLTKSHKKVIK